MERLPHAKGFWELIVYQRARELQRQVFECSKAFPKAETYALTDQMRRAARSIGAQIAEAWGKRAYEKHFVSKLTDATSEMFETQHWIIAAVDAGYLPREIGRMLSSMQDKSSDFCSDAFTTIVRESSTEWFFDQAHIFAA
ncbi:MAG: hypothetical protein RL693_86 [Verrucomicrobiota bacterium]|jgi:four helix bundle protein